MVRFSTYALFMTVLTIFLYFMGSPTIMDALESSNSWGNAIDETCYADPLCESKSNNNSYVGALLAVVGLAGVALAGFLLGFSAIYVLALVIVVGILNFFVFPIGIFITPEIIDPYVGYPLLFLFNVIEVLAITDFVRGGA
jgi:hypothetical protein